MQLDRRDFLKLSGAALTGGLALPHQNASAQASLEGQLGILYDTTKCIGCRACQMACKRWNNLPGDTIKNEVLPAEANNPSRVYDTPLGMTADTWTLIKLNKTSETDWHFINYQCMHCTDAACVTVCPTGAMYKDPLGFTGYDKSKCIGCGYCTQFCPYGSPHLKTQSVLTGQAKAAKCTFCQDRVYSGIGGPFCATTCPTGALIWGNRADLLAQAKQRVATLHDQGLSSIRLYGETEAGGLPRLSIIFGDPAQYKLPVNLVSPTVSTVWQRIIQVAGAVVMGAAALGGVAAFFFSRSHIHMEEVE
jgi:formate dehydrogenase beta subunit